MSLRRTAYVVCKSPKGAQKRKVTVLRTKLHFSQRKSAIKFLCAITVSGKVARHLLGCLPVHKWFVEDWNIPVNENFVH